MIRFSITRLFAIPAVFCFSGAAGMAVEDLEFFEKQIRPVLAEKCYSCHAADAKKLKGGLQLDHREHLMAGGDTGAAIVPGDIEKSLLVESIRYHNEDLQMPPKERLSAEIVKNFETWILAGAPWPEEPVPQRDGKAKGEGFDLQKRYDEHWSWRPVTRPAVPAVTNASWARTDVDRFILKEVEAAGLQPAAEAERRVWLRRVCFDLIGLPPTPEQLTAFLNDEKEGSYERVVDELLESPHYGEKWARHWMDLVRYADTYGHEFDYPIDHSYRYRDYLIRAFNTDLPYNDLVVEHIAGDLLDDPRRHPTDAFNESIQGTGFWFFHEATHAPTDVLGNEADIMDNQIDVFGKAFLGLTVSCARCHDHKFDAISTADYYAMTAYLHSSARQEVLLDVGRKREKARAELTQLKGEADQLLKAPAIESSPVAPRKEDVIFESFSEGEIPKGWSTSGFAFAGTGTKPGVKFNKAQKTSLPGMIDSSVFGKKQVGILRSPTFTIESDQIHLLVKGNASEIRLIVDNYQMAKFSALLFRGTNLKNIDTKGAFKWLTLAGNVSKYRGHKAYLEFIDAGDGELLIDEVIFSTAPKPPAIPASLTKPAEIKLSKAANAVVEKGIALDNQLPAPAYAVAMAEGSTENANVYVRGSHRSLGKEVPPRFLEALGAEQGNRLTLAKEVTDPENPLTSRVIVNRVWHHLFGKGIVASVDDFGPMGKAPTHPELLDVLAVDFVKQGWSLKTLIRDLVLSSTYRQSSESHPDVSPGHLAEVDPDNLLLSKMVVKRLTGESIRDSVLAVSGQLNTALLGPSIATHRTAFMTGRGGKKSGPVDGGGRRSVYGAVYRNFLSPFMSTFDVPGPFGPKGRRSVSNVPAQALVMMNDPFVVEQSRKWAEKLSAEADKKKLVEEVFVTALGRSPREEETKRLVEFLESDLASGATPVDALADLTHVVMNMKEFIFIQ